MTPRKFENAVVDVRITRVNAGMPVKAHFSLEKQLPLFVKLLIVFNRLIEATVLVLPFNAVMIKMRIQRFLHVC